MQSFLCDLKLIRSSTIYIPIVFSLVVVAVAEALAYSFGARQPVTLAMDVGLSVIKLLLPLCVALLVQDLVSKEFDKRYYLSSLSFPQTRSSFILGRVAAITLVGALVLLLFFIIQGLFLAYLSSGYEQATPVSLGASYWVVASFVFLDLLVFVAIATLIAVVAKTPSFVLVGSFGFLFVARTYGPVLELLASGNQVVNDVDSYKSGLGVISYFVPDLSALDVRSIALYGQWDLMPSNWMFSVASSLTYAIAVFALAAWLLNRKRFS